MALSGHSVTAVRCPLLGEKRTSLFEWFMSKPIFSVHGPFGTYYMADGEHIVVVSPVEIPALIAQGFHAGRRAHQLSDRGG
jgi:hypothetical protein